MTRRLLRHPLAFAVTMTALLASAAPAAASTRSKGPEPVDSLLVVEETWEVESVEGTEVTDEDLDELGAVGLAASSARCWVGRAKRQGKAAAGNTLYTFFVEGRWCANNGTITSVRYEWAHGETSTPGWSYLGLQSNSTGIRSNQGRVWARHKFRLRVAGITIQTVEPCARVRGTATGTFYNDGVCGLG